jgi:hypothetical protein
MLKLDLTVAGLPETLRDLDNINNLVVDEMAATMRRSIDVLEAAVVQRTPVGRTGNLRQAWSTAVERGIAAVKGILSNPLSYAIHVEKGARMAEEGLKAVKGQITADFEGVPARVARRANL